MTAQVSDPSITRYRPLIVQGEDQQNGETMLDRVKNEMNKRIGESRAIRVKVAGWRMSTGDVWPTNRRVAVDDDWLGANGDYLIEQASFRIAKTTNSTTLKLVPPQKYDISFSGTGLRPAIETEDTSRPWDRLMGPT